VISDLNHRLIETYRAVAGDPQSVVAIVERLKATKEGYYEARAQYNHLRSPVKRGAYFLFLNRLCWNGLYRQNKAGQFNVPYGRPKKPRRRIPLDWSVVYSASELLRSARIGDGDFEALTSLVGAKDFVYLDPPYVLGRQGRVFSQYTSNGFSLADEKRLASEAQRLNRLGAYVVVSHAFSAAVISQYGDQFRALKLKRTQTIAGIGAKRKTLTEVVLVSEALAEALSDQADPQLLRAEVPLPRLLIPKGLQHRGETLKFIAADASS
jgi:DNA adenine methylase